MAFKVDMSKRYKEIELDLKAHKVKEENKFFEPNRNRGMEDYIAPAVITIPIDAESAANNLPHTWNVCNGKLETRANESPEEKEDYLEKHKYLKRAMEDDPNAKKCPQCNRFAYPKTTEAMKDGTIVYYCTDCRITEKPTEKPWSTVLTSWEGYKSPKYEATILKKSREKGGYMHLSDLQNTNAQPKIEAPKKKEEDPEVQRMLLQILKNERIENEALKAEWEEHRTLMDHGYSSREAWDAMREEEKIDPPFYKVTPIPQRNRLEDNNKIADWCNPASHMKSEAIKDIKELEQKWEKSECKPLSSLLPQVLDEIEKTKVLEEQEEPMFDPAILPGDPARWRKKITNQDTGYIFYSFTPDSFTVCTEQDKEDYIAYHESGWSLEDKNEMEQWDYSGNMSEVEYS